MGQGDTIGMCPAFTEGRIKGRDPRQKGQGDETILYSVEPGRIDACKAWGCNGNCDGYQVNDRSRVGKIELDEDATDQAIVRELVTDNFLTSACLKSRIEIEASTEDFIEVNDASDGQPLYQLTLDE